MTSGRRSFGASGVASSWRLWAFVAVSVLAAVGYVAFILGYGVNAVYWDEWNWVPLVIQSMSGHLSFATLWAQHNEDRVFIPNLIAIGLTRTTRWNDFAFYFFSASLLAATIAVIIRAMWRSIRVSPLWFIFIPLVGFTLIQYENTLWAFQIAWFLVLFCTVGSLAMLAHPPPITWPRLVSAAVLGVVGSFSLVQGMLVWPVGLVVLFARGRSKWVRLAWGFVGTFTIGFYYKGYSSSGAGVLPISVYAHNVWTTVRALLIAIANVIPNAHLNTSVFGFHLVIVPSYTTQEIIGGLMACGGIAVIVSWFRQGRPSGSRAFVVALVLIGLSFNLLLIPSRLYNDLAGGLQSRYTTMSWPLLLGIYLAAVTWRFTGSSPALRSAILRVAALALVIAQVYFATSWGLPNGRMDAATRRTSADLLANLGSAPAYLVEPYLFPPNVAYVDVNALFLEDNRMNLFEGLTASSLRRLGIVPGGRRVPLVIESPTVRTWTSVDAQAREAWLVLSAVYRAGGTPLGPLVTSASSDQLIDWAAAELPASAMALSPWYVPPASVFLNPYLPIYQAWKAEERWHGYSDLSLPSGLRSYVRLHPDARLAWRVLSGVYANSPVLLARYSSKRPTAILTWAASTGSRPSSHIPELETFQTALARMVSSLSGNAPAGT